MNTKTMTISLTAGLGMPEHARLRAAVAPTCCFGTGAFAAFGVVTTAVTSDVQATGVSAYGNTTDLSARINVVPGILAWSPPI